MGLVQWRWSELAVALVCAGVVACSGRNASPSTEPIGAGAGGSGASAGHGGGSGESGSSGAGGTSGAGGRDAGAMTESDGGGAGGGGQPQQDASAPIDAGPEDSSIAEPVDESCLADISNFEARGPFTFEAQTWPVSGGSVKAWVPNIPDGCRVPVVHFGNGTGATCSIYQSTLEQLASHGFVAVCFESPSTASGERCLEAIELAHEQVPERVSDKVGFAGHQTGATGAFMCAYRAEKMWGSDRTFAIYAITPEHGTGAEGDDPPWTEAYATIDTPVFMFHTEGGLVSEGWVGQALDYLPATTEVHWYKAVGVGDLPIGFERIDTSIVPWLRWKLLGDREACMHFKALPATDEWDLRLETQPTTCD